MGTDGPSRWSPGWLLFPLLLSLYLFSFNGLFRVDDEHILAARAQSVALRGEFADPQVYGNQRVRQLELWGEAASQVEPGLSLVGAGLYQLGLAFGWSGGQALFLTNAFATAATAVLLYASLRALGIETNLSFFTALAFGATTQAMPYALTFYRDSLAMAMCALAMLGLARQMGVGQSSAWGNAGLILTGVVGGALVKNSSLTMLPALAVGLVLQRRSVGRHWLPWLLGLLLLAGGFLIAGEGALARFSWVYYRSLFSHFLTVDPAVALVATIGPWVSPAKSLFLFSPVLLLLFWPGSWRALPSGFAVFSLIFAVLLGLAQGLFYGSIWGSGFGWGLRHMLPALPALMVLAAAGLREAWRQGRAGRLLVIGLCSAGLVFQLAASWTAWHPIYQTWQLAGLAPYDASAPWSPRLLAHVPQVSSWLTPANWDLAWLRLVRVGAASAWFIPLSAACVFGLGLAALRQRWSVQPAGLEPTLLALALAGSFILPFYPQLALVEADPSLPLVEPDLVQSHAYLRQVMTPDDVLVVDSYGTRAWTYFQYQWDQPQPWYSLPFEVPDAAAEPAGAPSAATVDLLGRLLASHEHLYYLTTSESPDARLGREVAWLKANAAVVGQQQFGDGGRLNIHVFGPLTPD
ncbi:MAG TPA: hypothetical protein VGA52_02135 [Anaerolineales bacterium]